MGFIRGFFIKKMKDYFILEIFPKLGHSFADIEGSVKFNLENRECILYAESRPRELKIPTGSQSFSSYPQYYPVILYVERNRKENNPFIIVEKVCDILSLATKDHVAYFTPRISEYLYLSGWSIIKGLPSLEIKDYLKHRNVDTFFLDTELLNKVLEKINSSKYRERLYASFHMNRLAKYKAFSHITEAITDYINSVEALYMQEEGSYQSDPDLSFIPKKERASKPKMLKYFLETYYPGPQTDLNILSYTDFYRIRSGYLHRGALLEPASGDISSYFTTLDKANEFTIYNTFYRISFLAILNFVLTKC